MKTINIRNEDEWRESETKEFWAALNALGKAGMLPQRLWKGKMVEKTGKYWLYHGDCLAIMQELPMVDAIITDLPYGITQSTWDKPLDLAEMWRRLPLKENGVFCTTASQPFTTEVIQSNRADFRYSWVWVKNLKTGPLNARRRPMGGHEDIPVFFKNPGTYNPQRRARTTEVRAGNKRNSKTKVYGVQKELTTDRQSNFINPDTVLLNIKCVHNSSGKFHPNQKPVELLRYLIETYTNECETVLDLAMGSGTTGVAALQAKRKFIGIEKDLEYFNIAKERLGKE